VSLEATFLVRRWLTEAPQKREEFDRRGIVGRDCVRWRSRQKRQKQKFYERFLEAEGNVVKITTPVR
jgi:hypothetical protein